MEKVKIKASGKYEVIIGENLLPLLPALLKKSGTDGKLLLVTDKNVDNIYGTKLNEIFVSGGLQFEKFVILGGEESKSEKVYCELLNFLADKKFTRKDVVLAFGGGVTGDLSGFAAATYLRGIDFVQIPTTLLAAVDSSVGGKTAINLKNGKNLAGAFYQPKLVVCDLSLLKSLPEGDYASGMAEVIKYGMIFDKNLLSLLKEGMSKNSEKIIKRCVELKKKVVEKDEKDNGPRGLLNFGHTLGHAVEKCSGYKIPHGQAVAIGMNLITEKCVRKGVAEENTLEVLTELCVKYGLPQKTDIPLKDLVDATMIDKKRRGDVITAVLPVKAGKCILKNLNIKEWENFILN